MDEAEQERQGMGLACDSLGVDIHEINPDGHCLYSAIADQLVLQGLASSSGVSDYQGARRLTAQFMRQHKHDFAPFISDSDERMAGIENKEAGREQTAKIHKLDGEFFTQEGLGENFCRHSSALSARTDRYLDYCHAVETTSVWGGQPEILAMSRALNTPIWVVQAGQPIVKVGQEEIAQAATSKPLLISYHRRMYGLGEVSETDDLRGGCAWGRMNLTASPHPRSSCSFPASTTIPCTRGRNRINAAPPWRALPIFAAFEVSLLRAYIPVPPYVPASLRL